MASSEIREKEVTEINTAKLLLHRIPRTVPSVELRNAIPGNFTLEVKPSVKAKGDIYSAFAIFKNQQEVHQAYEKVQGSQEEDSSGRPQKLIEFKLSTCVVTDLYVRKMAHNGSSGQISSKRALEVEESAGANKKQKMVEKIEDETMADLDHCCDPLKEIERLKQEQEKLLKQHSDQLKDIEGLKQEIKIREYEISMLKKSQVATSSSGSSSNWEHDVFLSFRGEDTRHSFTDHLYYAMNQRGIATFRDTEMLETRKSISPELLKAIEESKFAVIVLSTNYATSTWCLDELAHILQCKKLWGLEVIPVFYHVEPSEIRKQTGNYGKAFAKHETDSEEKMRKVNKWREALKEIASISGWHVTKDRGESEVIQEMAKWISDILNNMLSIPDRNLIGMDVRIEKMESYLDLRSSDVLSVGIWGMGGIGKTTLAREVFKRIRNQFDNSGFVSVC